MTYLRSIEMFIDKHPLVPIAAGLGAIGGLVMGIQSAQHTNSKVKTALCGIGGATTHAVISGAGTACFGMIGLLVTAGNVFHVCVSREK